MTPPDGQLPLSIANSDVQSFLLLHGLQSLPDFVDYQAEGYDADWCHVNAKDITLKKGGKRVHGWALWQYPGLVMADFHSVWDDGEKLIDVTPPKFGAQKVLFVRDPTLQIYINNDIVVFQTNRSSLSSKPNWWEGVPTDAIIWGVKVDDKPLVDYCKKHSFEVSKVETDQTYG